MKEPSVAGIRFYVESKTQSANPLLKGGNWFNGTVTLTCHFNRQDLWDAITQRLHGIELHKGSDIQSVLIEIQEGRISLLEKALEDRGEEDRQRAQRAEQVASLATSDKVRAEQHIHLLKHQLDLKTIELDSAKDTNDKWNSWFADHKTRCPLSSS